jgi:hypothetical protein
VEKAFGKPPGARIVVARQSAAVESREAGGQRPRLPFEQLFQLNAYDQPFPRDPTVVDTLKQTGVIQPSAPLPGREAEVEALRQKYNLPRCGMI